jgi:DNA-binding protein Fis
VLESILDNFFLVQKNINSVSGLYGMVIQEAEYAVIKKTLKLTNRNKKLTAQILGISRNKLNTKIKLLKLEE